METRRELIEAVGERYRQSGMRIYLLKTHTSERQRNIYQYCGGQRLPLFITGAYCRSE